MNKLAKYVPKIQFLGKRIPKSASYTHKVVDYMRIPIEIEELEAINDGGVANMKWKKIKSIGI